MASNVTTELFATSDAEEARLLQLAIEASLLTGQKRKPEAAQPDEPHIGSKRSRLSKPIASSSKSSADDSAGTRLALPLSMMGG